MEISVVKINGDQVETITTGKSRSEEKPYNATAIAVQVVETNELAAFESLVKARAAAAEAARRFGVPKIMVVDNGRDYRTGYEQRQSVKRG